MMNNINIITIPNIPDIEVGDNISKILYQSIKSSIKELKDGDILCIAHKIFSKAEGCVYNLDEIIPSKKALSYANELNKDPRKVEVILRQSKSVLRSFRHSSQKEGVMICEHKLGYISTNAGVDESNIEGENKVITLPDNPDLSSDRLRKYLQGLFNVSIGLVMTDTFGRPWRVGQVNVAIGVSGVPVTKKLQGKNDAWNKQLLVTEPAFADEIAAASGLVMEKSSKTPLVIFRGLEWTPEKSKIVDILRKKKEDVFR